MRPNIIYQPSLIGEIQPTAKDLASAWFIVYFAGLGQVISFELVFGSRGIQIFLLNLFFYSLFSSVFWAIHICILHLCARLLRCRGELLGLLARTGQCFIVLLLAPPAALLCHAFGELRLLYVAVCFALNAWLIFLYIYAIKVTYQSSTSKSIVIFMLPAAVFAILVFVTAVLLTMVAICSMPFLF